MISKHYFRKVLLFFILLFLLSPHIVYADDIDESEETPETDIIETTTSTESVESSASAISELSINSRAYVVLDRNSNRVLLGKNENERRKMASTTKIMTAILTIENGNLNDVVTVPAEAISNIPAGYSIADLKTNEQLTVDQLLQLLMVHSANDAANVLAFYVDGSIEAFANRMNQKLSELGLNDSHFTNPSGIHDDNHYSTAHDIALLMQYCLKNSTFKRYSGLKSCKIPATDLSGERYFNNTNSMLSSNSPDYYPYITCTKTGFTSQARYCVVSSASKDNMDCICVILSADTSSARFEDTKTLFEYGFSNFAFKDIAVKGSIATQVEILNGTDDTKNLDLVLGDTISVLTSTDLSTDNITPQITLQDLPVAPIAQRKVLGYATYYIDGSSYTVDLLASHDVMVSTSKTYYLQVALLVVVVIALFVVLFWNNKGKKEKTE